MAKIYFTAARGDSSYLPGTGDIQNLSIQLHRKDSMYRMFVSGAVFEWSHCDEWDHWYGFHISISDTDVPRASASMRQVLRLLVVDGITHYTPKPETVLELLQKRDAVECRYDSRVGHLVPLVEILPDSVRAWYMDFRRMEGFDTNVATVLAETEDEAKLLIHNKLIKLSKEACRFYDYKTALVVYCESNMPVALHSYGGPQDMRPAEEMLIA